MQIINNIQSSVTDITAGKILNILRARYQLIIGSVGLCLCLAAIYIYNATPQYLAQTTLLIERGEPSPLAVSTILTMDSSVIESQVEIIRSRNLLARVANQMNLYKDAELQANPHPFITRIKEAFFEKTTTQEKTQQDIDAHRSFIITQIDKRLSVMRVGATHILKIGFQSNSQIKARNIVDKIAIAYLNDQLEAKLESTKRASRWLESRISVIRDELQQKERKITKFKQKYNLFDVNGTTTIEQQISRLNEQLILSKSNTAEKKAAYNQINKLARNHDLQSYSGVLTSNVITNLREKKSEITRDLANLSIQYGNSHPKLKNIKSQINDVESQISAEVKRILSNAKSEYQIARSREVSLASSLSKLRAKMNVMGGHTAKLSELENEAAITRTSFEAISGRFRQTDKSEDVQKSDARIISKAEIPLTPISPQKNIIVLVAIILGTMIGVTIALCSEFLSAGFTGAHIIEETLNIPVISKLNEIPKSLLKKAGAKFLFEYIKQKPLSALSEEMRKIRVHCEILFQTDKPKNVVMVTSSVPNEGKTEVASSYASSCANAGLKVLLVDCDFRNPSLASYFELEPKVGLGEYLEGTASLEDISLNGVRENIDFIGINALPNSPSDLLNSSNFIDFIKTAKQNYDIVIMDTPPLMPIVDSVVIAEHADYLLYVLAWNKTPRQVVIDALKTLNSTSKIAGIILNRIQKKRATVYGSYYYENKSYDKYYRS